MLLHRGIRRSYAVAGIDKTFLLRYAQNQLRLLVCGETSSLRPQMAKYSLEILCLLLIASISSSSAEQPLSDSTVETLRVPASRIHSPGTASQLLDLRSGIGPDEAATIALYSNPALRTIRDRRGLAAAQLIQAGIL